MAIQRQNAHGMKAPRHHPPTPPDVVRAPARKRRTMLARQKIRLPVAYSGASQIAGHHEAQANLKQWRVLGPLSRPIGGQHELLRDTAQRSLKIVRRAAPHRAATMTIRILNELLLFSCLVALVTGIVLAAAGLLI